MPRKPKRPCSYPGCPKLVDGQYCEEHKRLTDSQYNRYGRDDFTKNFYKMPEWRAARKQQLNNHPFCEECLKNGKRTKATIQIEDCIFILLSDGEATDNYKLALNNLDSNNSSIRLALSLGNSSLTTEKHVSMDEYSFKNGVKDRDSFISKIMDCIK